MAHTFDPAASKARNAAVTAAAPGFCLTALCSAVRPSLSLACTSAPAASAAWMAARQSSLLGSSTARSKAACSRESVKPTPGVSLLAQLVSLRALGCKGLAGRPPVCAAARGSHLGIAHNRRRHFTPTFARYTLAQCLTLLVGSVPGLLPCTRLLLTLRYSAALPGMGNGWAAGSMRPS